MLAPVVVLTLVLTAVLMLLPAGVLTLAPMVLKLAPALPLAPAPSTVLTLAPVMMLAPVVLLLGPRSMIVEARILVTAGDTDGHGQNQVMAHTAMRNGQKRVPGGALSKAVAMLPYQAHCTPT